MARDVMKHIIWSSDISLEDYQNYFRENGITDDAMKHLVAAELNEEKLERLKNIPSMYEPGEQIIVIGGLELIDGCYGTYNVIEDGYLDWCFESENKPVWYDDGYDLRCRESLQEGTGWFIYRRRKPNISGKSWDNLTWKIYAGNYSWQDILRCTSSLLPEVRLALSQMQKKSI